MLDLPRVLSGKVRELYDAGDDRLLMVASDRVSAFDVIMAEAIPDKGRVLTAMTAFWCEEMADVVPGTLLTSDPVEISAQLGGRALPPEWAGRAMLVRRAEMLHLECIVRGYLAGQAWEEYERTGTIHGMAMPEGLVAGQQAREADLHPLHQGGRGPRPQHRHGRRRSTWSVPKRSWPHGPSASSCTAAPRPAAPRPGSILADTKFELGYVDGVLSLCDEVCTPDSSRLWPADAGRARDDAAGVRQAAATRLARAAALGPHAAAARAPGRRGRRDVGALRRGVRARHRPLAERLVRCVVMMSQ